MKNKNLFIGLVLICVLTPGVHYFIAGKHYDHTTIRNVMVGVQILGGIALIALFGRKRQPQ